ncbi:tetratricopeptide repeat protein [Halomonas sp. M4R5S39]|uniref:tetratricopeptide repeat protein n=1 Tax=Halomonas kalidii TaxID=3043293 RepID=UPI0024A7EDF1|nr:tetratricopeptide repeat protein [Halomonas kalidii]MDI5985515.1 tetratricopeptide repeat protein [Halomonas kalidii]
MPMPFLTAFSTSRSTTGAVAGVVLVATTGCAFPPAQAGDAAPRHVEGGDYGRVVTTESARAQAYFDQGLRLAYGFARARAARSFRAAQAHDPDCALCYWGEAWALGPYLNNPGGVGDHEDAAQAARQALERADGVTSWERALIEAMAARYPAPPDGDVAAEGYAEAMAAAAATHGNDPEVRTLHAESLMLLRPWDLIDEDGQPYPVAHRAIAELEAVLAADLEHPGACHLYIHAVEAWEPRRAEACADLLADAIPGVSHIQHMPSHVYLNIGRYGDAVRGNQKARMVDQAARHGEAVSVYAAHNTAMLVFAAWMDGQSGVALSAARDLAREHPAMAFRHELQLARFGRWNELLERTTAPEEPFQAAMGQFARGLAHLRTNDSQAAEEALEAIRGIRGETPEDAAYRVALLGIAMHTLAGEIAAADGRFEAAEASLREAIAIEDGLPYREPEPWPIPARHVLGAVLLEANRPEAAEAVYREALEIHPNNGWSLKGLAQSLAARGEEEAAASVEERFERAWARADVWLPASRF